MTEIEITQATRDLYTVGWAAALLCMLICVWVAQNFLLDHQKLSTSMALFACAWALVLGAYADPHRSELASLARNIAAILFVYIGGLLASEGRNSPRVPWHEKYAMSLLFFVVVPSAITFPEPATKIIQSFFGVALRPSQYQIERVVGDILNIAGFVSLSLGAMMIQRGFLYYIFIAILLFYTLISEARTYTTWNGYHPMDAFFVWSLAGAKLALTITIGIIVARYARTSRPVSTIGYSN
jgi:hypothetical protein